MAEKPMVDGIALAGDAFAGEHGAFLQVAAQRVGDHLAHLERGARRRIDLVAVVRLDDLDVVAGGHGLGGHLEQLEGDVDAHAHVGRHHDGDVLGDLRDLGLLRVAEACGADDGLHAELSAHSEVRERAFGAGEVDEHLGVLEAGTQVGHDGHAAVETQEGTGVGAEGGAGRDVERAGQAQVGRVAHGFDQHVAHAARGAGNGDAAGIGNGRGGGGSGFSHADSVMHGHKTRDGTARLGGRRPLRWSGAQRAASSGG
jgi:hypothetical protein